MTYLVLARKWRPKRFAELVGQKHVVRALVNGIETGRLHHAFLFTGTRGVGKTTIARILAKALNCERGVSTDPCGVCSSCVDIDAGRFVDLMEIDAASRSKVDETRDLLDSVIYAPGRGRYKVYLIDEVHMLSTASFNALLKTLEEPPPHVKFLLATTDPQKVPVTVLSRCLQFSLKRLERGEISGQMRHILDAEGIAYEPAGIDALARAADGSLRDGLSLLDQALAFGGGSVRSDDVASMLGTIDRDALLGIARALVAGDGLALRSELERVAAMGVGYGGVLVEMMRLWHDVAARQVLGEGIESDLLDVATLAEFAAALAPETVQVYYQMTLLARRDLDFSPDHRTGFDMAMLRLLAFRPEGAPQAPRTAARTTPTPAPRPVEPAREPAKAAPPTPTAPVSRGDDSPLATRWFDALERADLRGPARELAALLKPVEQNGERWILALAPHLDAVNTDLARRGLEEGIRRVLGANASIDIQRSKAGGETFGERASRQTQARHSAAEAALLADPVAGALMNELGAKPVPGSLKLN